jgi:N6-adenosine-specific RNA methylase IME4
VNRTGKVAPEHKRLSRYETMTLGEIKALPVADFAADKSHLYLWTPNALVADGIPFTGGELAFVAASLFLPSIAP